MKRSSVLALLADAIESDQLELVDRYAVNLQSCCVLTFQVPLISGYQLFAHVQSRFLGAFS